MKEASRLCRKLRQKVVFYAQGTKFEWDNRKKYK